MVFGVSNSAEACTMALWEAAPFLKLFENLLLFSRKQLQAARAPERVLGLWRLRGLTGRRRALRQRGTAISHAAVSGRASSCRRPRWSAGSGGCSARTPGGPQVSDTGREERGDGVAAESPGQRGEMRRDGRDMVTG